MSTTLYTQLYPDEPQWRLSEEVIFQFCCDSITRFEQEQENRLCSALCIEAEPANGYLWISFETPEHDREQAIEAQLHQTQQREKIITASQWQDAYTFIHQNSLPLHSPGPEDYAFPLYSELDLDSWSDFAHSDHYPQTEQNYLNARGILVLWQVSQRLIKQQIIQALNLAFPFRISYCIHGESEVILQVLNDV